MSNVQPPPLQPQAQPQQQSSGIESLIPYRNGMALAAYYLGVFALIPGIGLLLGPMAIIFGALGLRTCARNPGVKGKGHAIAGLVLGSLVLLGHLVIIALAVFA